MKKTYLTIVTMLFFLNMNAQTKKADEYPKLFQKLVLDIGAMPISINNSDNNKITSYSIALGSQVTTNLDFRVYNELYNLTGFINIPINGWSPRAYDTYKRLWGFSIGANYKVFKGKSGTYLEKISLAFTGKLGVGLSTKYSEQEAIYYDFSARAYLGKIPYLSIGINRLILDDVLYSDIISLYFAFGLDI